MLQRRGQRAETHPRPHPSAPLAVLLLIFKNRLATLFRRELQIRHLVWLPQALSRISVIAPDVIHSPDLAHDGCGGALRAGRH